VRVSDGTIRRSDVGFLYSSVPIALSVTVRPQFVSECVRRSNQQEVGNFGAKFGEKGLS